jgi:type I restriction enzyme R subunit
MRYRNIVSRETDPNKLNDLQEALDELQIYDEEVVQAFFEDYYDESTDRSKLDAIIDLIVRNFNEDLILEQQVSFKGDAKTFVRTYSYLSRIMKFPNNYWEMLWLTMKHLIPHLKIEEEPNDENILEVIDMDTYRTSRIMDMTNIALEDREGYLEPIPVEMGGGMSETEWESLESIIAAFNNRFGDINWEEHGINSEEAEEILTHQIPQKIAENVEGMQSIINSDKVNAKEESNDLVQKQMHDMMRTNVGLFKMFSDDDNFKNRYQEFIFDMLWSKVKGEMRK